MTDKNEKLDLRKYSPTVARQITRRIYHNGKVDEIIDFINEKIVVAKRSTIGIHEVRTLQTIKDMLILFKGGQIKMGDLVTYDLCEGNPGALRFMCEAYKLKPLKAEKGFARMRDYRISGDKLYMLWNDCCDRDTYAAIEMMCEAEIETIIKHINYENGYGIPYEK